MPAIKSCLREGLPRPGKLTSPARWGFLVQPARYRPGEAGPPDARLLIDVTALAHEHARPYLPGELTRQIDQVLGQLRLGQVSAESHMSQQGQSEENDLNRTPAPPPTGTAQ